MRQFEVPQQSHHFVLSRTPEWAVLPSRRHSTRAGLKEASKGEGSPQFPVWTPLLKPPASNVTPSWTHRVPPKRQQIDTDATTGSALLVDVVVQDRNAVPITDNRPPESAFRGHAFKSPSSMIFSKHHDRLRRHVTLTRVLVEQNSAVTPVTTWNL